MALLYTRTETDEQITIIYPYQAAYYITLFLIILLPVVLPFLGFLFIPLVLLVALIQIIGKWKPNQEIKQALKKGSVQVSGSRFSFKNPPQIIIKK